MKNLCKVFGWVLVLACLAGCGVVPGGGNNNLTPTPPVPVFGDFVLNIAAFQGVSPEQGKAYVVPLHGIRLEEARAAVSDVAMTERYDGASEAGEARIHFPGTFVLKLISEGAIVSQPFPAFSTIEIEYGDYEGFRFNLKRLAPAEIPGGLLEDLLVNTLLVHNSLVVEGSFWEADSHDVDGDGQVSWVPFRIVSDKQTGIRVSSPNYFAALEGRVNYFFMAFDVSAWFDGLLPALCDLNPQDLTDGVALIEDKSQNKALGKILNNFEENVRSSVRSAPSEDGEFHVTDVDAESSSEAIPFFGTDDGDDDESGTCCD
jgi:hypothetical protein